MIASITMWVGGGVVGAAGLALLVWSLVGDRSHGRRCRGCRYSMEGVPGLRCPECGRLARSETELRRRPRKRRRAMVGLALLLVGGLVAAQGEANRRPTGWWSIVPESVLVLGFWATGADGGVIELNERLLGTPILGSRLRVSKRHVAHWKLRMVAGRALRMDRSPRSGGSASGYVAGVATRELLSWCLGHEAVASDLAADLLRSATPGDRSLGLWIGANFSIDALPDEPRIVDFLDSIASDPSAPDRDTAYVLLASVEPVPTDRLKRATRACIREPHSLGPNTSWHHDLIAVVRARRAGSVGWFAELLDDPDPIVRREAAYALRLLGAHSKPALERLRTLRDDPDEDVREVAALAIILIEAEIAEGDGQ